MIRDLNSIAYFRKKYFSMNPEHSWILDVVIKNAQLSANFPDPSKSFWLLINADGIPHPFSTPQVQPQKKCHPSDAANLASCQQSVLVLEWNCPARIVLDGSLLRDFSTGYLYVSLCSYNNDQTDIVSLAHSRISLRVLPFGSPKTLYFPLYFLPKEKDIDKKPPDEAGIVKLVATLSTFAPQTTSRVPGMAMIPGWNDFSPN